MVINFEHFRDLVKGDVDKVIQYSQEIQDPKTDRLIKEWFNGKKEYIELFGGNMIYEFPGEVVFELDQKEKHNRIVRFISQVACQWCYTELADFIGRQEEGFFSNITISDYTTLNGETIKKGTRLIKAFKYFVNNERSLADIQNEASRIIQENKISGKLCLSVHPLDYLSISENTYNWRSCHSLDGEYRAGNLSYMMDRSTLVCYLKGADEVRLNMFGPEVKWNSKKWRVLIFNSLDNNIVAAGRQYPFESKAGMDIVLKEMLPEAGLCVANGEYIKYLWSDWINAISINFNVNENFKFKLNEKFIPVGHDLVSVSDLFKEKKGSKNYNDLTSSSCYEPVFSVRYGYWPHDGDDEAISTTSKNQTVFDIGAYTYCLYCGEKEVMYGADTMLCEECELKYGVSDNDMFSYCSVCGCRVIVDDSYWVDDEVWCEHCYSEYSRTCECCGETMHSDYIFFHEKTGQYLCNFCYEEAESEFEEVEKEEESPFKEVFDNMITQLDSICIGGQVIWHAEMTQKKN